MVSVLNEDLVLNGPGSYSGSSLGVSDGNLVLQGAGFYVLDFDSVSVTNGNVSGPGEGTEVQVRGDFTVSNGDIMGVTVGTFDREDPAVPTAIGATPLANISIRATIAAGGSIQPGFVVAGTEPRTLLIRAVGPGLAQFDVTNFLPDPRFTLYGAGGAATGLASDNWNSSKVTPFAALAGAFALTAGSQDAAIVVSLTPGNYTAIVDDAGGRGGEVILEVYFIE